MTKEEVEPLLVHVESSTVNGRYYDEPNNILYIKFNSGVLYKYHNISIEEYVSISKSPSIGSKLREVVKGKQYNKL